MRNDQRRSIVVLAVGFEGALAAVAWLVGWLVDRPPLANLHWKVSDAVVGLAASLPMMFLFVVFMRWPVGSLAPIRDFLEEYIRPMFAPCTVADLALVSLAAGIGEEMLFRGVLQAKLSDALGANAGLLAASALFGLAHLITPTYAVIAGLIGVYLGWLWVASGNLMTPIVAHAAYDFFALVWIARTSDRTRSPHEAE